MDAGTISGICSAIAVVIGAVATFIYKVRGRSWREIFKSVVEGQNKDVEELAKVVVQQGKVIGNIVEDEIKKKKVKK